MNPMIDEIAPGLQEVKGEKYTLCPYSKSPFYDDHHPGLMGKEDAAEMDYEQYLYEEVKEIVVPETADTPEGLAIVSVLEIEPVHELILESITWILSNPHYQTTAKKPGLDENIKYGFEFMFPGILKENHIEEVYIDIIATWIYTKLTKEDIRQYTLCFFNKHNVNIWRTPHVYEELYESWYFRERVRHGYLIPHKVFKCMNLLYRVKHCRKQVAHDIIQRAAFDTTTPLGVKMFDIRLKLDGLDEFYD
tara:strand:- start:111 stop:857 length:747 start_codon:yes stop_codon:yes gene_type:complete